MGLSTSIVRYLFFAFNFVFWILGLVVLSIGIYSRAENDTWSNLIKTNSLAQGANLLIAAGVFVAFIGGLGCFGAIKKNQHCLLGYMGAVVIIFILEIAGGAYAYSNREVVQEKLTAGVKDGIQAIYGKKTKVGLGITKSVDWFQQRVKCCGAAGPTDWPKSFWFENVTTDATVQVPKSCCVDIADDCNVGVSADSKSEKIFNRGCVEAGKEFAKKNLWLVGGAGVGIAIVELLGVAFAILLYRAHSGDDKGAAPAT